MAVIHFFNFDSRFCGSRKQGRRVTLDPNEVTCPICQSRDCLRLTEQGKAYLKELDDEQAATAKAAQTNGE